VSVVGCCVGSEREAVLRKVVFSFGPGFKLEICPKIGGIRLPASTYSVVVDSGGPGDSVQRYEREMEDSELRCLAESVLAIVGPGCSK
jgi:hypothetical protein